MSNIDFAPPLAATGFDVYRIVSSRFPPLPLFDRITKPGDLEAVFAIEAMTNDRLRQEVGDEAPHLVGNPRGEIRGADLLTLALELRGHNQVETVRLSADLVVDPRQFLVELFRSERRSAEYAESAGVGHRGDHIAAMAEREERKIDAELFTDRGLHPFSITTALRLPTRTCRPRRAGGHRR